MSEILVKDTFGRVVGVVDTEMDGWREQIEKLLYIANISKEEGSTMKQASAINMTTEVKRGPVAYPTDEMIREMCVYHPAKTPSTEQKFSNINFATENLMRAIRDNAPGCGDREQAFSMARMARMMANSAIANDGRF